MQRYQFNANNVGNKFNNLPIYSLDPVTKQFLAAPRLDQYGGQVGGPVRIPHLYNGKDKTFFLFGIEQYNEDTPSARPCWHHHRGGAQRRLLASGVNIYDPYTTRLNANGTLLHHATSFPGQHDSCGAAERRRMQAGAGVSGTQRADHTTSANNYNVGANLSRDRYRTWICARRPELRPEGTRLRALRAWPPQPDRPGQHQLSAAAARRAGPSCSASTTTRWSTR